MKPVDYKILRFLYIVIEFNEVIFVGGKSEAVKLTEGNSSRRLYRAVENEENSMTDVTDQVFHF